MPTYKVNPIASTSTDTPTSSSGQLLTAKSSRVQVQKVVVPRIDSPSGSANAATSQFAGPTNATVAPVAPTSPDAAAPISPVAPISPANALEATEPQAQPENASQVDSVAATDNAATEPPAPDATQPVGSPSGSEPVKTEANQEAGLYADRFAKLSRREAKLLDTQKAIKAEQAQLEADRKAIAQFRQATAIAKSNPLAVIKAMGLEWNEVQNYALSHLDDVPKPQDIHEQRLSQAEAKIAAYEKAEANKISAYSRMQEEEAINRYKASLDTHVKENADKYELVNLQGAYEDVFAVVEEYHRQTGKILTPDQAASKVENYLTEQAKKLLASKKLSQPTQSPATPPASKSAPDRAPGKPNTITVKHTGASHSTATIQRKVMPKHAALKQLADNLRKAGWK